jgi:hypothetical protein
MLPLPAPMVYAEPPAAQNLHFRFGRATKIQSVNGRKRERKKYIQREREKKRDKEREKALNVS